MPHLVANDRLSWGDSLFLYLEREGMPLHMASVSVFEGIIPLDDCIDFVESRLPLIPRYRQRVVTPPFHAGLPTWEYDPHFDLRCHIRQVSLKGSGDAAIKRAAAQVLSQVMDRQRPLWDLTLLHDGKARRTALVARVHHCLADGIAGVALMNVLMDPKPLRYRPRKRKPSFQAPPPVDPLSSLVDAVASSPFYLAQRVLAAETEILNIVQQVIGLGEFPITDFFRFLPELVAPVERLPFNAVCRGPQQIAWAEIPLADIKAAREACGAKVNDVVLALVTAAVRRYAELHGVDVKQRLLRVMVPVNMRAVSDSDLGNRISLLPVTIPLGIRDMRKLVEAVHERMSFLKQAHMAEWVSLAAAVAGMAPIPLQAVAGPIASQLSITPFNMVCTNVPGPQFPLYLLGHKMLCWYPYVPIGGEMAVNCAILSYNGMAYFGFSGDVHAAPDLQRMEKFVQMSFAELRKAEGIKPKARRRAKPGTARIAIVHGKGVAAGAAEPTTDAAKAGPASKPAGEEERKPLAVGIGA